MNAVAVVLEGNFDVTARDKLREAFGYALAFRTVIVDLEGVEFLDSSVLGGFVLLHRAAIARELRLFLTGVHGAVDRAFRITELDRSFHFRPAVAGVAEELGLYDEQIERVVVAGEPLLEACHAMAG